MKPELAFSRFVDQFAVWWPSGSFSVGGRRLRRVVFEPRANGLIYEEHVDGRRFQWGTVLRLEAPSVVEMTWHPARESVTGQRVIVTFAPTSRGTAVVLTATDWHRWGDGAERARAGYVAGWRYVLSVWSGEWTLSMRLFGLMVWAANATQFLRGGRAAVLARAQGEMSS